MTRAEAKEAFNHVLDVVLDRGDASPLKSSLLMEGITDIFDLITLADDVIDLLLYEDAADTGKFYPVKKGDKVLFGKYSGTEIEHEGVKYLMMRQSDVLAVLE